MQRELLLSSVAIIAGIVVWVAISIVSGKNEAWDSSWYFSVGIPVLCLVSGLLARTSPKRLWRWAVLPLLAQYLWMTLPGGPGNLWPLSILFMAVLFVPLLIAAWIGANLEKWLGGTTSP